ncbi:HNH endonuclease [Vibrio coralliilyticus]|uniref:HNH endonuclease n=2 Tax=Vibrio TaxID=662 RepID=UPI0012A94DD5|nr:HNH endonuclease [Vibrio coralliilyticus]QFT39834.1 HNH endonuclease [Vibrio sp. THAF64]QGM37659.1 HNH endonuclease [Vibrio sp. THAF191d]QGN73380.1 HNH endonuclease [Vibrio sp. THAF191c]WFB51098.1 HNH endonuclease [Vibrio coralliilyticus]
MKLDVDLSPLWAKVQEMGAEATDFDIGVVWQDGDIEFDDELESGVEIDILDLSSEAGLLSVKGRQVILFIPDHTFRIEKVLNDGAAGNKFHIADCQKLDEMRRKNRFEQRYKITNNLSGSFPIYGDSNYKGRLEGEAQLNVCKYCLSQLNYQGAANVSSRERDTIVNRFSIEEFFKTYSSLFRKLPKQYVELAKKGYAENWGNISSEVRKKAGYVCQYCSVDLKSAKRLLHVHHRNGEKSDNSPDNLIALCADCHRKEPFHGHMFVKHEDMVKINQLRNEQAVYALCDWDTVKRKADLSLQGVLDHCEKGGYTAPEVSYQLTTNNHLAPVVMELAWPKRKLGVALSDPVEVEGWTILSLKEALIYFGKRSSRKLK